MKNKVNLTDLLQAIGPDNLNFQALDNCLEGIKTKGHIAMVTFGTEAITPADMLSDSYPHGIIIWVDRDLYQQRFQALQRGEGQTYGQLQAQLNEALSLLREAIGGVPQTQSFPSRCDAALAGKLPAPAVTVTESIHTERDELIDVLKNTHAASLTNLDMLASAILAAGFKRGAA